MHYGLGNPCLTVVRMGTRGGKYPCLPMCAWTLVAGNTLVYRCAHGHSWQEIPLFTDVRMGTRGGKYPWLLLCAWTLVAGNTLVYRCAHEHSWREILLFIDVRNRTRTRVFRCECKDHALFQLMPHTDCLTRTFCANAGLPADKKKKQQKKNVINGYSVKRTLPNTAGQ